MKRTWYKKQIENALARGRSVALLGLRQSGKTVLVKELVDRYSFHVFNLEDSADLARLADPRSALASLKGTVVIDGIQERPDILPVLESLLNRHPAPAKFLLLGSMAPDFLKKLSESQAGHLEVIEMDGLDLSETGHKEGKHLWTRGGLPLSLLAHSDVESFSWRKNVLQPQLEEDIRRHGFDLSQEAMPKFWTMLALSHGKVWNAAPFADAFRISEDVVNRYLGILTDCFIVRQIQPWQADVKKRQVETPKVYIRDVGLLHAFLRLRTRAEVIRHPICSASWEWFVLDQVIHLVEPDSVHFWAICNGPDLDLVFSKNGRMYGVEVKRSDAPTLTTTMHIAIDDLKLERLVIIYPGERRYELHKKASAIPFGKIPDGILE
ncbi:MAG TPA: ATP-binding protein [Candidatus Bathyarchaeia archaeon]|nr:ATP-binding protein [Candidatus Bathyarchaeia archaeon]